MQNDRSKMLKDEIGFSLPPQNHLFDTLSSKGSVDVAPFIHFFFSMELWNSVVIIRKLN